MILKKVRLFVGVVCLCSLQLMSMRVGIAPEPGLGRNSIKYDYSRPMTFEEQTQARVRTKNMASKDNGISQSATAARARRSQYITERKTLPDTTLQSIDIIDVQDLQISQVNTPNKGGGGDSISSGTITKDSPKSVDLANDSHDSHDSSIDAQINQAEQVIKPKPQSKPSMFQSITNLFTRSSDVNAKNRQGRTPLQQAVLEQNGKEIVRLVRQGADVNVQDASGNTLLHSLIRDLKNAQENERAYKELFSIFKFLIKNNAKINAPNQIGRTPLHLAVLYANEDAVSYLLKKLARVDVQDQDGNTPLMFAVHSDIPIYVGDAYNPKAVAIANIINQLCDAHADVGLPNHEGKSPILDVKDRVFVRKLLPQAADRIVAERSRSRFLTMR